MHDAYATISFRSYWAVGQCMAQLLADLIQQHHPMPRRILEWGCGWASLRTTDLSTERPAAGLRARDFIHGATTLQSNLRGAIPKIEPTGMAGCQSTWQELSADLAATRGDKR